MISRRIGDSGGTVVRRKDHTDWSQLPAYEAERLEALRDRELILAELEKMHPVRAAQVKIHLNWNRLIRIEESKNKNQRARP